MPVTKADLQQQVDDLQGMVDRLDTFRDPEILDLLVKRARLTKILLDKSVLRKLALRIGNQ